MGDTDKTVTDTEVLKAVGAAAGVDLTGMPRNDVQAVLYAVDHKGLSLPEAVFALVNIALVQKGLNEGEPADWTKAGLVLGPDVVKGVIALAALLA